MAIRLPATLFFVATFGIVLAQDGTTTAPPAPSVDRSGEPLLREMLASMGQVRNVRLTIGRYFLGAPGDRVSESAVSRVWYREPGVFRLQWSEVMGDAQLWVTDGRSLLRDSMGTRSVSVRDPLKSFAEKGSGPSIEEIGSVILWALDGEASLPLIAPEGKRVVRLADVEGLTVVESASTVGTVRFFARRSGGALRVVRVETQRGSGPAPVSFGGGAFITRDEVLEWESVRRFEDWVFDPSPPKGLEVRDERTSKKPGGW